LDNIKGRDHFEDLDKREGRGVEAEDFFFHWLHSPRGPWLVLFSFMIILQTIGLLGRVIS
jgi:hypothetical protein